ncbi:DUF4822 domain-containing protein [Nocardia stercoris]|uniref:DUF4822 domain-containing protein n=1 Tax=Nocardia stercoris TaxID=2483361 RepID=A0A3M2LA70_9NOCA|nr:DUF4822 domain-containing protein [Nocardia stercoris]RMI33453.1 DUF4822 domain-containing protein [Nocardia stercoris]
MRTTKYVAVAAALITAGLLSACGSNNNDTATTTSAASTSVSAPAAAVQPGTPAAVLASTPWETTSAKDAQGAPVALTDENVKNYVGFAYFAPDGTFTMVNLDDSPKMHGDWSVSPDGKTRTIVAKDAAGKEQFRRIVDIVTLTPQEFTYRVHPNAGDPNVYFDIVHTPTTHPKPAS